MNKKQVLFIGVGKLGSKVLESLNKDGYSCLAIHADYDLEKQIQYPQINLLDRHWRQNEYPGFTEDYKNIELLIEENKDYIKDVIEQLVKE